MKPPSASVVRRSDISSCVAQTLGERRVGKRLLHEVDVPAIEPIDPRRMDDRLRRRRPCHLPLGDGHDGNGAVLAAAGQRGPGGQVGDHVAEPEDDPHAVDLLDRLEDVGVVADDQVDGA